MRRFDAIDLSSLPAPGVVEALSFEAILSAIREDFLNRYPEFSASLESEPVIKLLEVVAYRETMVRGRVNDAARAVMLAFATGTDLDHLAAFYSVKRQIIDPGDADAIPPRAAVYEDDTTLRHRAQLAPDADNTVFPINTPVLLIGSPRMAARLGDGGTLKDAVDGIFDQTGAMVVVIRVEEGADAAAALSNIVGDATAGTGVHAFLAAGSVVKVVPRILAAPGFTSARPDDAANPVVSELLALAAHMRAVVIADGPNTTNVDAITYREDWGSDRLYVVDPHALVWDVRQSTNAAQPVSSRVAGLIARMDNENGFWWSPSNKVINGITGIARPVDFNMSDPNSVANHLNENRVATIIQKDGFRLWGNRTCTADPLWSFLSVRRTADMVYESVEGAFLWAMDRPFSAQLLIDIEDSVNAYLRHLKAVGAILGGRAWLDPELNTKDQLMAGKAYIDFDIEPPAPLEHLTFRAHRESGYYTELVAQVIRAA